ncbi:hypothetical protein ACUOFC_07785, partial [Escherichia sp. TWPC-MK]
MASRISDCNCASSGISRSRRNHLISGGTLVYATCSVLPEENSLQIKAFLQRTADA